MDLGRHLLQCCFVGIGGREAEFLGRRIRKLQPQEAPDQQARAEAEPGSGGQAAVGPFFAQARLG